MLNLKIKDTIVTLVLAVLTIVTSPHFVLIPQPCILIEDSAKTNPSKLTPTVTDLVSDTFSDRKLHLWIHLFRTFLCSKIMENDLLVVLLLLQQLNLNSIKKVLSFKFGIVICFH